RVARRRVGQGYPKHRAVLAGAFEHQPLEVFGERHIYPFSAGRHFGSTMPSAASWNTTSSAMPLRSCAGSHSTMLEIICGPSGSFTIASTYGRSSMKAAGTL